MKKTLITIAVAAASLAAFAQGKVSLQNDGGSLYTLASSTASLLAQDAALAGQAIPITGPLPSGVVLEVGLYAGQTGLLLNLVSDTLLNPHGGGAGPSAGQGPFTHVVLPFAGGSADYFQVAVWDSAYASPLLAKAAGSYYGMNNVFTMTPGTSIAYPAINSGGGTTWASVGNEAPLFVGVVPEPGTFALAGLGAAALLIFRRRNK